MVRKQKEATEALQAANEYVSAKRYEQAIGILKRIDPNLLTDADRTKRNEMLKTSVVAMSAPAEPVKPIVVEPAKTITVAQESEQPKAITVAQQAQLKPVVEQPSNGLAEQAKALGEVEFQKLRADGLKAEADARDAFNKGETDVAIAMLMDYTTRVKQSSLTASRQERLLDPVQRREQTFRMMKRHKDYVTNETTEKRERVQAKLDTSRAEVQKQAEIQKKVAEVHELVKGSKYRDAEAVALQTKMLDPDNPTLQVLYDMAKRQNRVAQAEKLRSEKEEQYFNLLHEAEQPGPVLNMKNPIQFDVESQLQRMQRGDGSDFYQVTRTPAEHVIEQKLDKPLSVDFKDASFYEVLDSLREKGDVNISIDDASLTESGSGLSYANITVTEKLNNISLKSVLGIVLEKARLTYIIEDDVIKVTTKERAKGRLFTKVFSVMDLVTPIPDFALADHQSIAKAYQKTSSPMPAWQNNGAGGSVYNPNAGLQGAELVGQNTPWSGAANAAQPQLNANGTLDNNINSGIANNVQSNPIGSSATLAANRANTSAELMRLITGIVRPYEWQDLGGPGKLAYYDIGGALVVNQTADVIREVQDLLASLRRLQETSVAVEIRVISLSEAFYERVGVDFAMNIETNRSASFERSLTTGAFRPEPFTNSIRADNVTVGYNPAGGGFTPDLNFPVRPSSFGFGIPPFGGYPGPNPAVACRSAWPS